MRIRMHADSQRPLHVLLALALALLSSDVFADTIHARIASGGLNLQLTPLSPGGATALQELDRSGQLDGYVYSDRLRTSGFTQYRPDNPFPIEHEFAVEDGASKAYVLDSTGRGAVELSLSPTSYLDRRWTARTTTTEYLVLLLSPATMLTATVNLDGQLWLGDQGQNQYDATGMWRMTAYCGTPCGPMSTQFNISSGQVGFPVSEADYLQLVIRNVTDEPLRIFLETVGEVTASWQPSTITAVPEPVGWQLLAAGLLGLSMFSRLARKKRDAE